MKYLENRKIIVKNSSTDKEINSGELNLSIDNLNNVNEIILGNIKINDKNKKSIYNEKTNYRNKNKIKDLFQNNSLNEINYEKMNRTINLNIHNNKNIYDNINFLEKIKNNEKNLFLNKRKSYKKKILVDSINNKLNYSDANSYLKKKLIVKIKVPSQIKRKIH